MRKLIVAAVAGLAALVLTVPGAFGGATETGVTANTVVIGGTFPLTGIAASYAPIPLGMKAYFSYVNARRGPDGKRGVYGRQIVWKYYDDGYNPAQTVQLTRKLVEQDKVFADVGSLGTEPCLAVRGYLNAQKVPQVLVSTGATELSAQYKQFPWTIGWQPDYIAEGRYYGIDIRKTLTGQKIGVLYQNDAYGLDYLYGLRAALGTNYANTNIVSQQPYDAAAPSVASQVVRIKASGAQVFVIIGLPTQTVRAIATAKALGYAPSRIYINSVAAIKPATDAMVKLAGIAYVNGIISTSYYLDPSNPSTANVPAMKLYRQIIAKYGSGADANDPQVMYGVAKGATFVQAMYAAGKSPTRASLMYALTHMNSKNPFLLPGMVEKTSPTDHFILSQMLPIRYENGVWQPAGKLFDGRPR